MFREIILPIFRSTRLCVTACGIMHPRCCRLVAGRQHRGFIIPQAVTHSLVLLKMDRIIARNMLSWLDLLISRYFCIWLVVYIIYINDARSSKYHIMKYICWSNILKNVLWRAAKRLSYIEDARCLKVKGQWFLYVPPSLTLQDSTFCSQSVWFCVVLRINSDYFSEQRWLFLWREGKFFTTRYEPNLNVIKVDFRLLMVGISTTSSIWNFYFTPLFLSKFDILVESCFGRM